MSPWRDIRLYSIDFAYKQDFDIVTKSMALQQISIEYVEDSKRLQISTSIFVAHRSMMWHTSLNIDTAVQVSSQMHIQSLHAPVLEWILCLQFSPWAYAPLQQQHTMLW